MKYILFILTLTACSTLKYDSYMDGCVDNMTKLYEHLNVTVVDVEEYCRQKADRFYYEDNVKVRESKL